jgi:hypothetical protein
MKKVHLFILSMSLLALDHGVQVQAQQSEITEALVALNGKINIRFPVVDSLHPFTLKGSTEYQKDFGLSKQEASEIKKYSKKSAGKKLDSSFIHGSRLISSQAFYKAYQNGDSLSLSFIEKNKPFYTLSVPLFFNDGQKAVLDMDLIGRGGYTYLLVKKQGKWVIEKEFVRWIV